MSQIIDAHMHLWQLGDGAYSWLTPELGLLYRSFRPDDVEPQLVADKIDGVVLVQADDTPEDTRYMLSVGEVKPWVKGVVGWIQLDTPRVAAEQLDEWGDHAKFRGVRHLVHTDARATFLDLPSVRESLSDLSRRSLTLDVPDAWPRHLTQVKNLAEAFPELKIVVDHLGKPPLGTDQFPVWRREIADVAKRPNVFAKVSGLRSAHSDYSAEAIAPAWDVAIELFGAQRLMWGSDWPMPIAESGYASTRAVLTQLISSLSPFEQRLLHGATASAVYSLTV